MTELERAKADVDYFRHVGGFAYKQARRHYGKLLRKERMMRKGKKNSLSDEERRIAIAMFRRGDCSVKEICDRFGIYHKDLRKMVEEEGYGY